MSMVTVAMEMGGVYDEWWAWMPVSILMNISVSLAVYALLLFYHAFDEMLDKKRQRPLAKFLCIKVLLPWHCMRVT
jgi:hypothetical protein